MEYKTFMEALKGKQHKLDKNKNGKLDAHDFKLLRKEESDLEEETVEEAADRMARSDYKLSPSGRKTHKEITFPTSDKDDEKKEMKEEIEELDERNKENATRRKMMDASRGARFKAQGNYTPDPEPEHKTAQAHNKAVGRAIRKMSNEETKKDDLPFTPDPVKKNPIAKAGKFGIGPSTAKHLAKMGMQQAMKKTVKEETDESEKTEMAQTQLHFIKYAAMEILEYIEMGGEIEEWYQNKLSKVQSEVESLHSYIEGEKRRTGMVDEEVEIEEQAPVAPVPDKKYIKGTPEHKAYMATKKTRVGHPTSVKEDLDEKIDLGKAKMGDVIKDFQASDAPQFAGKSKEKRREMAIAAKLEADRGTRKEETEMLSYKEFISTLDEIKMADLPTRRVAGTYGTEYYKKEREKDEQGFDAKDDNQSTEKRGRGRPAGAKSGARGPRIK
jgi:hypothetical protein